MAVTGGAADLLAPSEEDFEALARAAFDALPDEIRRACAGLAIRIADFADEETLDAMEIEDAFELTGLYQGLSLPEKSHDHVAPLPDQVFLYRRPILDEWAARGNVTLGELIAHVLVHEIAHHFGWSDEEIAAIDDWTA